MRPEEEIVILSGARTPFGKFGGALKDFTATELGTIAARAALERSRVPASEIDHVVFGNAQQTTSDALYLARHIGLKAGIPVSVPALTVNRLCGSGFQSIITAAQLLLLKEANFVVAGGTECMSQAPHIVRGARWGIPLGQSHLEDSLWAALTDAHCGLSMAMTAENLADRYGVTREEADLFAHRSQMKARDAQEIGRFAQEMAPIPRAGNGTEAVDRDESPRYDTTLEGLASLKPVFKDEGIVTAGNASGIADGAAAVVLTTATAARERGYEPMARVVSWGIAGCEPAMMGIGPVPAMRNALARAGLALDRIDLVEVNEAFACQYLAVEKELGLDRGRVNVNGGAIALGHPLGASGTRITLTLLHELRRRKARFGLGSACIGGGQGIALLLEAL